MLFSLRRCCFKAIQASWVLRSGLAGLVCVFWALATWLWLRTQSVPYLANLHKLAVNLMCGHLSSCPVSVMTKAACPGLESLRVGNVGSALFLGSASAGHMPSLGRKPRVLSSQRVGSKLRLLSSEVVWSVWKAPHWNPISSTPLNA